MIVVGGWPGRNVVGLNGAFGVRPGAFSTGGAFANPLLNDVDAGDTTTEFVLVVSSLPGSGTVTLDDYGGFSHTGAADGSYTTTATLYTWAQGGPITQHSTPESIYSTFGSASQSFSPSAAALVLAGFAPAFTQSAAQSFSPAAATLALTGLGPTFTQSGNLMFSPAPAALALAGNQPVFVQAGSGGGGSGLIVEDGTGMPNAESYASVATADAYHARRPGANAWAALSTDQKESALIQATDYLQATYSTRWKGIRLTVDQALDWPRSAVVVDRVTLAYDQVPAQVVRATCELALRSLTQPLTADESAQVKSEKIGSLEVVYADGARQQTRWVLVEQLLSPLIKIGPNTLRVTRA